MEESGCRILLSIQIPLLKIENPKKSTPPTVYTASPCMVPLSPSMMNEGKRKNDCRSRIIPPANYILAHTHHDSAILTLAATGQGWKANGK
jgi:hypothetical protein